MAKVRRKLSRGDMLPAAFTFHFIDSGSFTLQQRAREHAREHRCGPFEFYETDEFWKYMDDYAKFVKTHKAGIDHFANVDVIPHAALSLRNFLYLRDKHKIEPVPVVHYTTPAKHIQTYMDMKCPLIALGGLVGKVSQRECQGWIDSCFQIVHATKDRMPLVKIHGFGVTAFDLLVRYPWYSVDSTSWTISSAVGNIYCPYKKKGVFTYDRPPYVIAVSEDSPKRKSLGTHFSTLRKAEKTIILEWLEQINIPFGDDDNKGVVNDYYFRYHANLLYFEHLRKALPQWPQPFSPAGPRGTPGFGFNTFH